MGVLNVIEVIYLVFSKTSVTRIKIIIRNDSITIIILLGLCYDIFYHLYDNFSQIVDKNSRKNKKASKSRCKEKRHF